MILWNKGYYFITYLVRSAFKKGGENPGVWVSAIVVHWHNYCEEIPVAFSSFGVFILNHVHSFFSQLPSNFELPDSIPQPWVWQRPFSWPISVLPPLYLILNQSLLGLRQTCGVRVILILSKSSISHPCTSLLIPARPPPHTPYQPFLSLESCYVNPEQIASPK